MRYELNFDEDKIIDIEAIGDDSVLDLNDCCKIMNEQQKTIKKQDIEIQSLNSHIEKLVDGDEISKLLMREYERSDAMEKEIRRLEKMIWKIQWRFQQEVGIEKAREHYREIDKEMEE